MCYCIRNCQACDNYARCGGCKNPPCSECPHRNDFKSKWEIFVTTLAETMGIPKLLNWLEKKLGGS